MFEVDDIKRSVVAVRATVPENALTAQTLGTERAGNGVVISDNGEIFDYWLSDHGSRYHLADRSRWPVPTQAACSDMTRKLVSA